MTMENLKPQAPFPDPGRRLDKFFKALSDPTRRGILTMLHDRERTVGEIVDGFHLSQPTISRHLSVLKEAGLVADQRRGQHVVYRLCEEAVASAADEFFGAFRQYRVRAFGARAARSEPVRLQATMR